MSAPETERDGAPVISVYSETVCESRNHMSNSKGLRENGRDTLSVLGGSATLGLPAKLPAKTKFVWSLICRHTTKVAK